MSSKLQLDVVTTVRGCAIWWTRTKAKGRRGVVCRLDCVIHVWAPWGRDACHLRRYPRRPIPLPLPYLCQDDLQRILTWRPRPRHMKCKQELYATTMCFRLSVPLFVRLSVVWNAFRFIDDQQEVILHGRFQEPIFKPLKARGYVAYVFYFLKDTYYFSVYVNKNRTRCNYNTVVQLIR